jgi:hypothetical protein
LHVDEREERNQIPCIVDDGLVVNRKDMVRILRDLGHVKYTDILDGQVRTEGEGFIYSVFANYNRSTIFVNKRLYINVNSFSHIRLSKLEDGQAAIDLVEDERVVRLLPQTDPLQERQRFMAEPVLVPNDRIFAEDLAEVYQDEDYDEPDAD